MHFSLYFVMYADMNKEEHPLIEHIVMVTWQEETTAEVKERILLDLLQLKDKIPGIISFKVGHNFSARADGFEAALTSTFIDQESLDNYGPHPAHVEVATRLRENTSKVVVVDFHPLS